MKDSKNTVNLMYDYRVMCSYDQVLSFKQSAAVAAAKDTKQQGISDAWHGLVQIVADNFDTDISSSNGKLSTHSLAMIITQPMTHNENIPSKRIRCLKREEMSIPISYEQKGHILFMGQKKQLMPERPQPVNVQEMEKLKDVSVRRGTELDFGFIKEVLSNDKYP